jgi:hypothetical protein
MVKHDVCAKMRDLIRVTPFIAADAPWRTVHEKTMFSRFKHGVFMVKSCTAHGEMHDEGLDPRRKRSVGSDPPGNRDRCPFRG